MPHWKKKKKMYLPDGFTEQEVIDTLERVVNMLAKTFRIGYYDIEDMKQEGYVYGIEVLPRYNAALSSLETFLYTHIRNQFMNFRRNKVERKTPPCATCPFFHPEDHKRKCYGFDEEESCPRWKGWFARNQTKRNLMETAIYDDEQHTVSENVLDNMIHNETIAILERRMPIDLLKDFRRLLDGASLPKTRMDKVYDAARDILAEDLLDG